MNYGIQLYSIKDVASVDLHEALRTVASLGYTSVEFAGFFNNSADDVKAWLDELGLTVTSTHTGLAALTPENIAATAEYHKAIGCDYIIVPHANWSTEENLEANIAAMNYAYDYLKERGISLAFHNHSVELLPHPYGKVPMDEIIKRTSLELEPDVFFFSNSDVDAIAFLEKYSDRIKFIHLKDGTYPSDIERNWQNPHEGIMGTILGQGYVPIADIARWGTAHGKELVVEVECKYSTGPIVTKGCIEYLKGLEL